MLNCIRRIIFMQSHFNWQSIAVCYTIHVILLRIKDLIMLYCRFVKNRVNYGKKKGVKKKKEDHLDTKKLGIPKSVKLIGY